MVAVFDRRLDRSRCVKAISIVTTLKVFHSLIAPYVFLFEAVEIVQSHLLRLMGAI
jgi:hypothetical protein